MSVAGTLSFLKRRFPVGNDSFCPSGYILHSIWDIPDVIGAVVGVGDAADIQRAETRNGDRRHPPGKGQPRHRGISSPEHRWYPEKKRSEVSHCSASSSIFYFIIFEKNVYLFGCTWVLVAGHRGSWILVVRCGTLFPDWASNP